MISVKANAKFEEHTVLCSSKFAFAFTEITVYQRIFIFINGFYSPLSSLAAVVSIATILHDKHTAREYSHILERGKRSYGDKLWNGKYYNYDASSSLHHDSIMTDQMAGQWYAKACGLSSIVPGKKLLMFPYFLESNAYLALKTVYEMNVKGFKDGKLGAINGIRPDGTLDHSCMQSLEVWTGTTFAAAAAMLQQVAKLSDDTDCS